MARSRRRKSKSLDWIQSKLPKLLVLLIGGIVLAGGAYYATRKSPEDHLQAGIALQQSGDLKGASIELKNALQGLPNNADARSRLGRIHFALGDYPSAEKELKRARTLGAGEADLDPLYARTLLQLGELKQLLEEVTVKSGIPADTQAAILALRARAQILLKDTAAGLQSLKEADGLVADHPEALITRALMAVSDGHPEEALVQVDKALGKDAKRADFWLLKGNLLRGAKQRDAAMEAFTRALALEPGNVSALLARAQTQVEAANLDKASADLKELRKYSPNDVSGRYLEAFIAFKRGSYAESNETLQGILRTAPDFLPGHLLAGTVNIVLGQKETARIHLDKVLGAVPNHPLARKLMAATLADLGDLDKAKDMLATFGSDANDALLHNLQGQIALRQGNYTQARKYFEEVPDDAPRDAQYFTSLAASRMGSGDDAGAVAALNKASELDTDSTRPEVMLVLTHVKEKRIAEALKVVDKLEKERPDDPLVPNLRGAVYLAQQDVAKAKGQFVKALEKKPAYFPAASNLALLDMRGSDMKSARTRFEQLLKHNPKEDRAWLALAALDRREGKEADYIAHLDQAVKANSKSVQAHAQLARYWLGKNDPGKALVEARAGLNATGRAEFNEFIGLALAAQGDHADALATLSKWAEGQPKNPMAQFRLAQAQIANKDKAGAVQSLDKALALRPDFTEASLSKALLLGQLGRAEEGLKVARDMQARQPKAAAGLLAEADILFGQKKFLESGRLYARAAQLADQGQPLANAYRAYASAGQPAEGEKLLNNWLQAHPNDLSIRHQIALIQLNSKRLAEAAAHYRILIRANPKDVVANNNLAWLLGELRDKDALSVAEQAYKLNPENAAIIDTFGWILVNSGQAQRGLDLLKRAQGKAPGVAEIHWHLAAGLAKAGDKKRAKQELQRLLDSGQAFPQQAEAKRLLESLP